MNAEVHVNNLGQYYITVKDETPFAVGILQGREYRRKHGGWQTAGNITDRNFNYVTAEMINNHGRHIHEDKIEVQIEMTAIDVGDSIAFYCVNRNTLLGTVTVIEIKYLGELVSTIRVKSTNDGKEYILVRTVGDEWIPRNDCEFPLIFGQYYTVVLKRVDQSPCSRRI